MFGKTPPPVLICLYPREIDRIHGTSQRAFVYLLFWCRGVGSGVYFTRAQGKKGDLDKAYRIDKDLAAAEAKRLIAMEKRQEDDAYLLSREYDDDYDDQVCVCV